MLVVVGEALIDVVTGTTGREHGRHEARPGGSPLNVAVGCARLGVPTAFLGRLSTDSDGRRLREHLGANGVDLGLVVDSDEPTAVALAQHDEHGVPRYSFRMTGTAERGLVADDVPPTLAPGALHTGSLALVLEPIATTVSALVARLAGRTTVTLDPNVRPALIPDRAAYLERLDRLLDAADLVKVSTEDLSWLAPGADPVTAAGGWLRRPERATGPRLVLVTRGAEGAVALTRDGEVSVPGRPVSVVDTIGAGDSFMSAVLAWLHGRGRLTTLREWAPDEGALRELLTWAVQAAAITCGRRGADPPWREELPQPR